eukprot:TRINITY_DN38813_c0_g1_i1.p1 TRINITY_DN38813_c0_g1~~TRINITY_DN38813_c0_g1_i1.p1  ORF type:complete len:292 (-),score=37.75 TRINITY_DN38813_c0_g1_i1:109-984(-)
MAEGFKEWTAGTIGGVVGKAIEYPLDTLKVRLQAGSPGQYAGAWDCFRKTLANEGFMGLYKGLLSPVCGAGAECAVLFFTYGRLKALITKFNPTEEHKKGVFTLPELVVSGFIAGGAVAHVLTPVELIKCRLQVQEAGGAVVERYNGPVHCAKRIIATEGIKGLFRGHKGTLLREMPGNAAWFGVYEVVCKWFHGPRGTKEDLPAWKLMLAGGVSGMAYWTAFFPADVVKSQQQIVAEKEAFSTTFKRIYRNGGVRALYAGWGITMVRALPSNAVIFCTYEKSMVALNQLM